VTPEQRKALIKRIYREGEQPNCWHVFVGDKQWDVIGNADDAREQARLERALQEEG